MSARVGLTMFVVAAAIATSPLAVFAQDDAGGDVDAGAADGGTAEDGGAPDDGGAPGDAAADAFAGPVDGSRPDYPLLRDGGGTAWICSAHAGAGDGSASLAIAVLGVGLAISRRRRSRRS